MKERKTDEAKKVCTRRYLHGDHLGSVEAITDEQGSVVQRYAYDVWGAQQMKTTEYGFTGHEQLKDLGLVHMIGRVYDPVIGRFCSADPLVQAPGNSQSYNRYSYCINNPLSLTDPSGYSWFSSAFKSVSKAVKSVGNTVSKALSRALKSAGKWIEKNWKMIVVVTVTVVVSVVTLGVATAWEFGAAITFWDTVAAGAIGGAVNGGLSTALNGGSLSQVLQNTLRGAVAGAATAGVMYGIGSGAEAVFGKQFADGLEGGLVKAPLEGAAGGGLSAAEGGSFKSGFIGGAVGCLSGAMTRGTNLAEGTVISAAAGGTVSALCGGSFANGAVAGAFAYLFNAAAHAAASGGISGIGSAIGDFAGKIWSLPSTAVGIAWGMLGEVYSLKNFLTDADVGHIGFGNNAIQFKNNPLMFSGGAITLGNAQEFNRDRGPETDNGLGIGIRTGTEEGLHTIQGQWLGAAYLPAHIVAGSFSVVKTWCIGSPTGDRWHDYNFMESGPMHGRAW